MTEIKIVRDDEKATAILKAIRQIDAGLELDPVVRCKDCKKSGMYNFGAGYDERFACLDIEEDGFIRAAASTDPNYFCASGERRADHD